MGRGPMLSMKTIVLTGAGGGIGSSVAKAFLAKGYAVFGLDGRLLGTLEAMSVT